MDSSARNGSKAKWFDAQVLTRAVTLVAAVLAFIAGVKADELPLWNVASAWAVVLVAYWAGSLLDPCVFDRLYGADCTRDKNEGFLKKNLKKVLDWIPGATRLMKHSRRKAAARFRVLRKNQPYAGLYATVKMLFSHTEEWDEKIKPLITYSKVARTLDLSLRMTYMNTMYQLVSCARIKRFQCHGMPGSNGTVEFISVGHVVVPVHTLAVLKTPRPTPHQWWKIC